MWEGDNAQLRSDRDLSAPEQLNQNLSSLVLFEFLKNLGSNMVVHVYSPIPLEAEGGELKVPNQPELRNVSPY